MFKEDFVEFTPDYDCCIPVAEQAKIAALLPAGFCFL